MDTTESSAPHTRPSTEDHDDTVEAHYSCLEFVQGWLTLVGGPAEGMNLGALATVYQVGGLLYIFGGLLFGIATLRAGILSRWAAGLLTVAPLVAPVVDCSRASSNG